MLGFGFSELAARRRGGFQPLQAAPRAWYDPSDLSTLFQDAAGTIAVAGDGDPVGRIEDKSGNGFHMTQPLSARRAVFRSASGLQWLETDGAGDSYNIASRLDFAPNPDIAVISALRPLSNLTPIQRVFHLGGGNQVGTLACAMGDEGYSWRFNNGNARFSLPVPGADAVVTWQRQADSSYADSLLRLNGTEVAAVQTVNDSFVPTNTDESAALFSHGTQTSDAAHIRCYGLIVLGSAAPGVISNCENWLQEKMA